MNRIWVCGPSAALAAALGGQALAGDPNMQPGQTTLVQSVQNLFTSKPSKPGLSAQSAPPTINAPLTPTVLSKCLQAEQDALWRRLAVCDALRGVADEKGDPALSRQADELEKQATALYKARTAALGLTRPSASLPDTTNAMRLEDPVSPQTAASRLIAPASPVPSASTPAMREVKP
jgi:hypothetical protein